MTPKKAEKTNFFSKWGDFFIRKYKVTVLLLIGLIVAGTWGIFVNQRQDFPEVSVNYTIVTATYPGASAENVEKEVITPIENEIGTKDQVGRARSTSSPNFGTVSFELDTYDDKEIDKISAEIQDDINKITFPEGVEIETFSPDAMGPAVAYTLASDTLNQQQLLENATPLKEYLEGTSDEIKKVDIYPEAEFDIEIILNSKKLLPLGLSANNVKQAVQAYINTLPAGSIEQKGQSDKQIDIKASITSLKELRNISFPGGIKLNQIASIKRVVSDEEAMAFAGYVKDGKSYFEDDSVYIMIYKKSDGDIVTIHDKVTEALKEVHSKNIIPENIEVVEVYNTADAVRDSIGTLLQSGLIGLIAILIVFLFFIDLRTGIVIGLVVPLAFLITLFILPLIGFSINILTLFAMILTLGILVDNAIVIAEGITHRIDKYKENKYQAALRAIRDLGPAVTAATLTTIVVFIPFATMGGIMGEIMKYIPYTIIAMLVTSYLLAITITPLFSKWILSSKPTDPKRHKHLTRLQKTLIIPVAIAYGQRFIHLVVENYGKLMEKIFKHKKWSISLIVLTIIAFFASISLLGTGQISTSQFPENDGLQIEITTEFPKGTNIETKKKLYREIFSEAIKVDYFTGAFNFDSSAFIFIKDASERENNDKTIFDIENELTEKTKGIVAKYPEGTYVTVKASNYGPPMAYYDVTIELKGKDIGNLEKAALDLDKFVKEKDKDGTFNIKRTKNEVTDELVPTTEVELNKNKASQYGITPFVSSTIINSIFSESKVGKLTTRDDGVSDNLVMKFSDKSRDSVEDLENIIVTSQGRQLVRLKTIANVKSTDKSFNINHIDGQRSISYEVALEAEGDERTELASNLEKEIQNYLTEDKLAEFELDKDDVSYGGFISEINTNFNDLIIIFILAMLAVFIILVYQFNSYVQPLMIMFTIPIALIGVFPGLWLIGDSVNMISGLGIIALVGIVVNDAIVFIDYYNRQTAKRPNASILQNLVYTGKVRFRPIFSTSITTIAGVLPITIIDPFWRGLGTCICCGLVFSTVGTLVILPILLSTYAKVREKIKKRRKKKY